MKHPVAALIAAAALALAGASAHAQQYALTSKNIHLRAGPGRDYPVVAVLPAQMQVLVYGCIPSYTWCDVLAGYDRGWVYAGNLLYDYGNRMVVLPPVAAIVGIGQARRGWLAPQDVLNARPLAALMPLLARTMGHPAPRAERQLEPTP